METPFPPKAKEIRFLNLAVRQSSFQIPALQATCVSRTSASQTSGIVCFLCEIVKDMWGHDQHRGHLKDVTFKNITAMGATFPKSTLAGFDADHTIESATFDHVTINGTLIKNAADGKISTNPFVRNLQFFP